MPVPKSVKTLAPLVMVRLAMVTMLDWAMWNTRLVVLGKLPSTARLAGPGPGVSTLFVAGSLPPGRAMVPETPEASIVSPSATLASASRNVPGPLSAVLVTVIVAARALRWLPARRQATTMHSRGNDGDGDESFMS